MKPIIVNMNEMSDSTEVYESRPNPFFSIFIYGVMLMCVVAFLWMNYAKIDVVVKSNGIFKTDDAIYDVSSGISGRVSECHVSDGQYVREGDILYVLKVDNLNDTIMRYQTDLEETRQRLAMLTVYEEGLDQEEVDWNGMVTNPYYAEFVNRRTLLMVSIRTENDSYQGQKDLYQGNIKNINSSINEYRTKIAKLNQTKQCIIDRQNSFSREDNYYYSIVSSYIAAYEYTNTQYDNQVSAYLRQINSINDQLEIVGVASVSGGNAGDVSPLLKQKETLYSNIDTLNKEKTEALKSQELQQVTLIEQQIDTLTNTIQSLESNVTGTKLQLENMNDMDTESKAEVVILTEKGNIAAEILQCKGRITEYETYLRSYEIQNANCVVKANASGYFYRTQEIQTGTYVQEGYSVGRIYPEQNSKYYAYVYVDNADIAKVQVGQKVTFEIAAYPAKEYGYFSGVVENIAKDITVDPNSGYAYYPVKVTCDSMTIQDKDGREVSIINGMACRAKIIIDEETVLHYVRRKINL